jgi:hypothetical protein
MANLLLGQEFQSLSCWRLSASVGLIRHPQVGAEHVDTGLPVLFPVIRQASHRVHAGESHCGLPVAELGRDRSKPLVEQPGPVLHCGRFPLLALLRRGRLGDPLSPVGHNQGDKSAGTSDGSEHKLRDADRVAHGDGLRIRKMRAVS